MPILDPSRPASAPSPNMGGGMVGGWNPASFSQRGYGGGQGLGPQPTTPFNPYAPQSTTPQSAPTFGTPSLNPGPNSTPPSLPPPAPPSNSTGSGGGGGGGQFMNLGGWNPYQYATDQTTQNLIGQFGGTMGKTAPSSSDGPYVPQQNVIDFGNGYTANAGLMQNAINIFGPDEAKRMFAAEAQTEAGTNPYYSNSPNYAQLALSQQNLGLGTNPAFANYDPSLSHPTTFNNISPFTNQSASQYAPPPLTPQSTPSNQMGGGGMNMQNLFGLLSLFGGLGGNQNSPMSSIMGIAQLLNALQQPQPLQLAPQVNYY